MTKVFKITGRSIGILLEWILILVIFLAFAIRSAPFQTYLGQKAAAYLSKELKTTVKVDYISILFFDEASLNGVLVLDEDKDTLIYAQRLYTTFDEVNLGKKLFKLERLEADDAYIHLKRDTAGGFNYDFIKDYFSSNKPKQKKSRKFSLSSAKLVNSRFRYDDASRDPMEYGVDYWHLDCSAINVEVDDITYKDDVFTGKITQLDLDEKSGFHLDKLLANVRVSGKGVELDHLQLETPSTQISSSQFNLVSNTFTSFKYFVDSVKFDTRISKSTIDLADVAYFAPVLKGMNDTITLTACVKNQVADLRMEDVSLRYSANTTLKGNFNLTDYRNFEEGILQEKIAYAYIDLDELEKLRLPDKASSHYITINKRIKQLGFVQTKDIQLSGIPDRFEISAKEIHTDLGSAKVKSSVEFRKNLSHDSYLFSQKDTAGFDIHIVDFHLGELIGNKDIGVIDGEFACSGEAYSLDRIDFDDINGLVNRFDYLEHAYTKIEIDNGSYKDQVFMGEVKIRDDYLNLAYDGKIDFKGHQEMDFKLDLNKALLENLNLSKKNSNLASSFDVKIKGRNAKEMSGEIKLQGLVYTQDGKMLDLDNVLIHVSRGTEIDTFRVTSSLADFELTGKVDFTSLIDAFEYQFAKLFPSLMKEKKIKSFEGQGDNFFYTIKLKNTDDFFSIFYNDLRLSTGTELKGFYDGASYNFTASIESDLAVYKGIEISGIELTQLIDSNSIMANYIAKEIAVNDSLSFKEIHFKTNGGLDQLSHELTWEGDKYNKNPSHIGWHTTLNDWNDYAFVLEPSYFYIEDRRWDIEHESKFRVIKDTIDVEHFELTRDKQLVKIDGRVSPNRSDHLNFKISDFEVSEVSQFISSDYAMEGKLNGWGYLSDPFNSPEYIGDAALLAFKVNKVEFGDIFIQSEWDHAKQSISAQGDLIYKGNQTFDFDGHYYLERESDNLDFDLIFDYTDIQFVNAFLDPDVMSEVRGILIGSVQLGGTPTAPILSGSVNLAGGSTYIDLLGVHFGIDGPIEVDEYGFYINNIPVFDEEGNAGYLIGSIYHESFRDFNFDLQFDLERDAINKDPVYSWKVVPLQKFLLMNAAYSPDYPYYGKGYGTGSVNIFGYTDNLEITVDVSTVKGTAVSIPMYGLGELEDQNDFIIFDDSLSRALELDIPKINLTGVDLDLNFHVTQDADLRIVFDENIGDELIANGYGDITITMDNFGDVRMDGLFTIDHGVYNFAMVPVKNTVPVKQKFFIEKGGTINWTGDPYDANLNLSTYYKVNANISDISQDIISTGNAHQPVLCYLNLKESLLKPTISFDIKAPQANDLARQLIARVTGDKDELNRQFFSLLLWKKFQPLSGTASASGSAAADLIANQINSLLSVVSSDYKLNVAFNNDQLTGDKQYEFGVSKTFLDDRLILSGSFGVENFQSENSDNQNNLIGDVNLEYLLNESGTFRVEMFNQSTDKTVIQQNDLGRFTQGAGITYKEDFNSFKDFKAVQYFFDIFRKKSKKRYPRKGKKEHRPVPPEAPLTRNNFRIIKEEREV